MAALDDVYERWDGLGIPAGRRGEELSLAGRIVHVAEQAVLAHAEGVARRPALPGTGGGAAAVAEVSRRSGGHLDPDLATRFVADADEVLAALDARTCWPRWSPPSPARARGSATRTWRRCARRSRSSST